MHVYFPKAFPYPCDVHPRVHVCTCIHACALITDQQISVLHVVCVCVSNLHCNVQLAFLQHGCSTDFGPSGRRSTGRNQVRQLGIPLLCGGEKQCVSRRTCTVLIHV